MSKTSSSTVRPLRRHGTPTGSRTNRGKLSADIGSALIDRAKPRIGIKKNTVPIGLLREHEQVRSRSIRNDQTLSLQAFRQFLERAARLIGTRHSQAHKILESNFDRHRATTPMTGGTHSCTIGLPCRGTINIRKGHARFISIDLDQKPAPRSTDDGPRP